MKKRKAWLSVLVLVCLFSGCSKQEESDYTLWFPEGYSSETGQAIQGKDYQLRQETVTNTDTMPVKAYSAENLVELLLDNQSRELADKLWESQIANGVYTVTQEELNKNMITYYISSSEGDDKNLGLSPEEPKKTLDQFSGKSNITVLLKCGDVFEMESGFAAGNGCIYATYGQGSRPVVSFYQKLTVPFEKIEGYANVWVADLLNIEGIYNGKEDKDNCNIGQLIIDGDINWKRVVCSTAEYESFDFPGDLAARADGSWSVDWLQSKLYLYSKENPNSKELFVAPDVHGIVFEGDNNTVLKGWTLTGAGAHGCNIKESGNIDIQNCFFYNIGGSVHRSAGVRYGNAVQVWNSGWNINIAYNYADWIFDSCYTNQGSSDTCYCENVFFEKNIGAHSFTGIETWADSYSQFPFKNMVYRDNIIYGMCDITDPAQELYADNRGKLLLTDQEMEDYVSYRGGYTYNQMSCINLTNSQMPDGLLVEDNTFWNPKRLLVLCSSASLPKMYNNYFYAEISNNRACMFRYKNMMGEISYVQGFGISTNEECIVYEGKNESVKESKQRLVDSMEKIIR